MFIKYRNALLLTAVIALPAGTGVALAAPAPSCKTLSANFLHDMENGHFKAATTHFNAKMKAAATPDSLQRLWQSLSQKYGAFEQSGTPKKLAKPSFTNVTTPLKFANGSRNAIISCNTQGQIQGLFFKPGSQPANKAMHLSPQALKAYVGRYQLAPHFILKIYLQNDRLYAQATGQSPLEIFPSAKDQFFAKAPPIRISFQRGKHGKVTGLVLHQHGDHPAPRIGRPASVTTHTSAGSSQPSKNVTTKSCLQLSADLLKNLQQGNFTAATAHFGGKMKSFGPQRTKQGWQEVQQLFGKFERAAKPKLIRKHGKTAVMTPLQFANSWGKMAAVCNDEGRIVVWNVTPASAPGAPTTFAPGEATSAWVAAAAVGAKTLPIAIQRNGFMLKGVLDLPAGKGPFGVVDIIPGSGPVPINGNVGRIQDNMYKQLASALVKAGWAVARVAKRYMPPSTGNTAHYTVASQVADNLAIVKALKNNPHVNPKRIVAAGHSLGGLIAPKLATETELAGLILLEAPGTPMTKISTTQVLEAKRKAGASATQLKAIKLQNKFYARLAKAAPGQTVSVAGKVIPPGQVQLFKSLFAQTPIATASKVNIPVLVVQGGKDTQVIPGNGKRLVEALPHGKLLYLPKMDHDLTLQQDGTAKGAKINPKLTAGIVRWLKTL